MQPKIFWQKILISSPLPKFSDLISSLFLQQIFSEIGRVTSRKPGIMLKITNYGAKRRKFYTFALIFLKTAGNYDFSHILAELTAYFFPVFEKSLFLPPPRGALSARIFPVVLMTNIPVRHPKYLHARKMSQRTQFNGNGYW